MLDINRFFSKKSSKTSFFIFFFERSGSSWLVDLLNSHPEVSCKPEIFHLNWKKGKGECIYTEQTELDTQLAKIFKYPKAKACGFKFKYPVQYKHYPYVFDYLKKNNENIRLIFLYRKNRLKGAISRQNMLHLKAKYKIHNIRHDKSKIKLEPLNLDIKKAIQYAQNREKADFRFFQLSKTFKHQIVISYEDLFENPLETIQSLYRFLGVEDTFVPKSSVKKATHNKMSEAISNYDELIKTLKCHPLEKYID